MDGEPVMSDFYKHETRSVDELIPYINNSRTHSEKQVSQIAASIKEFGVTSPILIDEKDGIIAGHGRLAAMKKLKMKETPVIVITGLTKAQKKAYVIADNKLALNAGWDETLLISELAELADMDFDLELTGFELSEIDGFGLDDPDDGLTDEDATPPLPKKPCSVEGDIWLLGEHRVMCGDSTDAGSVALLMDGQKADMVFTDPPYGMSYGGSRARGDHSLCKKTGGVKVKAHGEILGDNLRGNDLIQMIESALKNSKEFSKEGAAFYTCFTWRTYSEFEAALENANLAVKNCIVWDKKSIGLGNSHYRPQHEFIFYSGGQWYGDKAQSDLWAMSRGAIGKYVHPTQKPVELVEKAIENSSKKGDIILDVFGGSGSTCIAAQNLKRKAFLVDLDPKYCDVIVQRWQDYTGQKAKHENGRLYDDLYAERGAG